MNIESYKQSLQKEIRPRTVTLFIKGSEVLLGFKKTGFGKGKYVGIGGKVENETIKEGATREIKEEININISPEILELVAVLYFYFPHISDESWNQVVHVFVADGGKIHPQESSEISPKWLSENEIPYDQMWDDAKYWLSKVLVKEKIIGEFMFDENLKVKEHKIEPFE